MINFDNYTNENKTEHNIRWPYIPDHPHRILIIGDSRSEKKNQLLKLINHQPDIDKICVHAKYLQHTKYQYIVVGLNHYDDHKAFIEHSNDMQDIFKNIEEYNLQ